MNNTPKANRLHIAIFGRTNVGKSSVLNTIVGQDISITSSVAGTTTDVVEKTMEMLPIGPVVFLDTAGLDDTTELGKLRINKSKKVFDRADVIVLVVEPNIWTEYEEQVLNTAKSKNIPHLICINKIDISKPTDNFIEIVKSNANNFLNFCSNNPETRRKYSQDFREILIEIMPEEFLNSPTLLGDIIKPKSLILLLIPIDFEAPKGRIILPQVQTIRDILDNDAITLIVKESEYKDTFALLKRKPDLVICDSQVVLEMIENTPQDVHCTTFSILFARLKADFKILVNGANAIDNLKNNDKILIAEACSHHVLEGDIGRIKIPKWLENYTGCKLKFDVSSGKDYPDNLEEYKLIIHCGGCMINNRLMLSRMQKAIEANVAITNYGLAISKCQGVLARVLEPFQ